MAAEYTAPVDGFARYVDVRGQVGLLDIVVDPKFASNHRIFFKLAEAWSKKENWEKVDEALSMGKRLEPDLPGPSQ